ncbi:MAG TPA: copper oxidase [Chthoniobacterales bacterium]|nr:copper oxidase [Chthoniobacterales bacterium]
MISRRKFFSKVAAVAGVAALGTASRSAQGAESSGKSSRNPENIGENTQADRQGYPPGEPGKDYTPVITPNGSALPYKVIGGVKVFHLIAEEVDHEFALGLRAYCWGFNGQVHGPTIEAVEGDRVRIYVTNKLPENTSIHWHGLLVPSGMDGVAGLSQKNIGPGETYKYEFQLRQHGTYMYHSHSDEMTQIALGMMGMFVIHPRTPTGPKVDRDFALMSSEWRIDVGTKRPVPTEMTGFNVLTFNGRTFPGTAPLVAKYGDRVRIRFGNLSPMDHHPIHLHGFSWKVIEMDGSQVPQVAQQPGNTVLVAVGQTRAVEFIADNPGDWAMHCHMTHHTMNQMGHNTPNLIGVRPDSLDKRASKLLPGYMTMGNTGMADMGEMGMPVPRNSIPMVGAPGKHDYIDMGGMFTILKVRENLTSYDDPGWYENPPGSLATLASNEEMQRDLG